MTIINRTNTIVGIVAGIFGVCATLYTLNSRSFTQKPVSKDFLGSWTEDYKYPTSEGFNHVKAVSSIFEDGSYNVKGEQLINGRSAGSTLEVTYSFRGAGEWSSKDGKVLTKLDSLKSVPIKLIFNGHKVDLSLFNKFPQFKLPTLEKYIPNYVTQKYHIVKVADDEITLQTLDPEGHKFYIVMKRVP